MKNINFILPVLLNPEKSAASIETLNRLIFCLFSSRPRKIDGVAIKAPKTSHMTQEMKDTRILVPWSFKILRGVPLYL